MSDAMTIHVEDLTKLFPVKRASLFDRKENYVHAIDGISFDLRPGEVLGLVGESGCGKSTLSLTLMGLEKPSSGAILFDGKPLPTNGTELKAWRRSIQMVFQDPYESLNPLMTIREIVAEPVEVHHLTNDRVEINTRVTRALEDAGLKPATDYMDRYPHELSGGQRQRVVLAGALVLEPKVLLADEPVSMLDVSIRAEILNLLADLRTTRNISILYITHDMSTIAYFADRIAVMYLGRIVEIGTTEEILKNPQHPYTKALLSVVPVPNPRLRRERIILQGETPNPIDLPPGCRFHPRCPVAVERCSTIDPALYPIHGNGHSAACIRVDGAPESVKVGVAG
jgi:oligopeptide/dipeptide ABC transporter ATP-binding protein